MYGVWKKRHYLPAIQLKECKQFLHSALRRNGEDLLFDQPMIALWVVVYTVYKSNIVSKLGKQHLLKYLLKK